MPTPIDPTEFLGLNFHNLTLQEVLSLLGSAPADCRYRYLVTPNVDHVVRLDAERHARPDLERCYDEADLCLCDSRVLAGLARLRGRSLSVVPGSDLTRAIFDRLLQPGDKIAVVGGDHDLIESLSSLYPGLIMVQHCPPMGLAANAEARREAALFIAEQDARFTFIAVGSPQQELIALEARQFAAAGRARTALCVGASLDFIVGRRKRAPKPVQRLGLEWAYRLISEPQRLWRRYLVDGPRIFLLAARWRAGATTC